MKKKYISPKVMFEEMEASYLLINSKFNEEEGSGKVLSRENNLGWDDDDDDF